MVVYFQGEPCSLPDWAAQVRAVHGKNLELLAFDTADPAGGVHGLAVGRHHVGISKRGQARLTLWELADATKRHPGQVGPRESSRDRRREKAYDRYGKSGRDQSVEENPQLHEQSAPGDFIFV